MTAIPNLTIPAGKIYWDPRDPATGLLTGEMYMGNTPGATFSAKTESVEVYSADDAVSEKVADLPISVSREFKFKANDLTDDNLAIFIVADKTTVAQTGASVTAESLGPVKQGRWYQLGTSANETGRRGISAVTVKVGAATMDITDDYLLDLVNARVFIVVGGAINDGDEPAVDYTYATNSRVQLRATANNSVQFGALRFIANNTVGPNRNIYFPSVALRADGDVQIKREGKDGKVSELGYMVAISSPADGSPQMYVDGVAA